MAFRTRAPELPKSAPKPTAESPKKSRWASFKNAVRRTFKKQPKTEHRLEIGSPIPGSLQHLDGSTLTPSPKTSVEDRNGPQKAKYIVTNGMGPLTSHPVMIDDILAVNHVHNISRKPLPIPPKPFKKVAQPSDEYSLRALDLASSVPGTRAKATSIIPGLNKLVLDGPQHPEPVELLLELHSQIREIEFIPKSTAPAQVDVPRPTDAKGNDEVKFDLPETISGKNVISTSAKEVGGGSKNKVDEMKLASALPEEEEETMEDKKAVIAALRSQISKLKAHTMAKPQPPNNQEATDLPTGTEPFPEYGSITPYGGHDYISNSSVVDPYQFPSSPPWISQEEEQCVPGPSRETYYNPPSTPSLTPRDCSHLTYAPHPKHDEIHHLASEAASGDYHAELSLMELYDEIKEHEGDGYDLIELRSIQRAMHIIALRRDYYMDPNSNIQPSDLSYIHRQFFPYTHNETPVSAYDFEQWLSDLTLRDIYTVKEALNLLDLQLCFDPQPVADDTPSSLPNWSSTASAESLRRRTLAYESTSLRAQSLNNEMAGSKAWGKQPVQQYVDQQQADMERYYGKPPAWQLNQQPTQELSDYHHSDTNGDQDYQYF